MSSTTSDLGSSIERSRHLHSANNTATELHISADSALSDSNNTRGTTPPKCNMGVTVKLRSRSANQVRSANRPHSVAEFAVTSVSYTPSHNCRNSTLFDEYDWIDQSSNEENNNNCSCKFPF